MLINEFSRTKKSTVKMIQQNLSELELGGNDLCWELKKDRWTILTSENKVPLRSGGLAREIVTKKSDTEDSDDLLLPEGFTLEASMPPDNPSGYLPPTDGQGGHMMSLSNLNALSDLLI